MKHFLLTFPLVFLLPACGPGDATTVAGTDSMGTDPTDSETGTTAGPDTETTAEPEPEPEPAIARGITITKVTADQGVEVPIGLNGGAVGGEGRNTYLVAKRETLFRVEVDVEESWTPRDIRADLTLRFADNTEQIASKVQTISGPTDRGDFESAIWWYIPTEFVGPGLSYSVSLHETTTDYNDLPDPEPKPMLPVDGGVAPVGVEDSYMVMKVGLIPVKHEMDGRNCADTPEISEDLVNWLRDQLYMQNPVDSVEIEVQDPITYQGPMKSFSPLLSQLSQLRAERDTPPEMYLYGLVKPCDGGADGVGGQAYGIPQNPNKGSAYQRVSMGRLYSSIASTANTFVHEVGHCQGRFHIACNGTEAGTDQTYPYEGGDIGGYGFGILNWTVHPPTNHDYMTYCGNTWVSDWGWNKVFPVIEILSSWDFEDDTTEMGTLLVGALYPDGTEDWWTTPGYLDGEVFSDVHRLELRDGDEVLATLPATYNKRPDDDTINVAVQLPDDLGDFTAVDRIAEEGARHPVKFERIKWLAK